MASYQVECTFTVYKNTQEGLVIIHGSNIPKSLSVAIAICLQRLGVILHQTGENISLVVDCQDDEENGNDSS